MKILIVDAEPLVRSAIKRILEHENYAVNSTGDPKTAIEILKADPPDLLLTNVNLPGMTGHDAMSLFKQACPGLRVLMISGLPDQDFIKQWLEEDKFDVFPKPFSAKELVRKVREVTDGDGARS